MKNKKPKLTLVTISALAVLMAGYTLLVLVIIFREEINLAFTPAPVMAEVEVASVDISEAVPEPKTDTEQLGYINQVLADPGNLQQKYLLPGRAYLEGKTTSFLMGF